MKNSMLFAAMISATFSFAQNQWCGTDQHLQKMYNAMGTQVKEYRFGSGAVGKQRVQMEAGMASGVYIAVLTEGTRKETFRFIIK